MKQLESKLGTYLSLIVGSVYVIVLLIVQIALKSMKKKCNFSLFFLF